MEALGWARRRPTGIRFRALPGVLSLSLSPAQRRLHQMEAGTGRGRGPALPVDAHPLGKGIPITLSGLLKPDKI